MKTCQLTIPITSYETQIKVMKDYLLLKFEEEDWHGVSDAANDIREIEAQYWAYRQFGAENES